MNIQSAVVCIELCEPIPVGNNQTKAGPHPIHCFFFILKFVLDFDGGSVTDFPFMTGSVGFLGERLLTLSTGIRLDFVTGYDM